MQFDYWSQQLLEETHSYLYAGRLSGMVAGSPAGVNCCHSLDFNRAEPFIPAEGLAQHCHKAGSTGFTGTIPTRGTCLPAAETWQTRTIGEKEAKGKWKPRAPTYAAGQGRESTRVSRFCSSEPGKMHMFPHRSQQRPWAQGSLSHGQQSRGHPCAESELGWSWPGISDRSSAWLAGGGRKGLGEAERGADWTAGHAGNRSIPTSAISLYLPSMEVRRSTG